MLVGGVCECWWDIEEMKNGKRKARGKGTFIPGGSYFLRELGVLDCFGEDEGIGVFLQDHFRKGNAIFLPQVHFKERDSYQP